MVVPLGERRIRQIRKDMIKLVFNWKLGLKVGRKFKQDVLVSFLRSASDNPNAIVIVYLFCQNDITKMLL